MEETCVKCVGFFLKMLWGLLFCHFFPTEVCCWLCWQERHKIERCRRKNLEQLCLTTQLSQALFFCLPLSTYDGLGRLSSGILQPEAKQSQACRSKHLKKHLAPLFFPSQQQWGHFLTWAGRATAQPAHTWQQFLIRAGRRSSRQADRQAGQEEEEASRPKFFLLLLPHYMWPTFRQRELLLLLHMCLLLLLLLPFFLFLPRIFQT